MKRPAKATFRSAQRRLRTLEKLEARNLLAIDVAGHHHDHDEMVVENWTPPSHKLTANDVSLFLPLDFSQTSDEALEKLSVELLDSRVPQSEFRFSDVRVDSISGATHIYLQQTLKGSDVVNAVANFTLTPQGEFLVGYSSFVPTEKIAASDVQLAALSPSVALAALATTYEWELDAVAESSLTDANNGATNILLAPSISSEPIPFDAVFVPVPDGSLELAWRLNVQALSGDSWLDASVSAIDGEVLFAADWVSNAQYEVFSIPKESPSDGPRTIRVDPQNAIASPFGWHDTNGVAGAEFLVTNGNNAFAYTDVDANNIPDAGSSPSGGAGLIFTPPLDFNNPPATNVVAATVNAFYVVNAIHDFLANKGFDAAAGNFQVNNYGAGGLGNDAVNVEVQDGGTNNNANFSTPPDGTAPRMQMGVFTSFGRDSSFDNGVIIHEFGHGVTNRLTGGPANSGSLSNVQSRGMGEGWSDFFALMYSQIASDTPELGRGIGTYALAQPTNGLGIRTQRYSYDMSVNTHTFADILGLNLVHQIGETWASTLWDLNWALIGGSSIDPNLTNTGLGFTSSFFSNQGGNNLTMRLVVQALKLQPANPTFLDARDAILAADALLNAGANVDTIWRVFARRGMGVSADDGGTSANTNGIVEAFDIPLLGSLQFERQGLFGSTIATASGTLLPLGATTPAQVSFYAGDNTKTSFTVVPNSPTASLTVQVLRPNGSVAVGPISGAAGESVSIPPTKLPAGNYKFSLTSSESSPVQLTAARNAAQELQIGDTTQTNELLIDSSFQTFVGSGINGVVGRADAGITLLKTSNSTNFIDISTTGSLLLLADDGFATISTTVGNELFAAGSVTVFNNGGIVEGINSTSVGITNLNILTLPSSFPTALLPFWDDIDNDTGGVYWREQTVGGIPTLIVQWENRPHFSNVGSTTFQLQLFASGPVLARFVYEDVVFENASFDFGASASIGYASPEERSQFSFNQPSLANNDQIEIRITNEFDEYEFNGVAGQKIDVAFDALGMADTSGTVVRLMRNNTIIASAVNNPIQPTATIANYDLGIHNFVLPTTGVYTVRIVSLTDYDYYLAVSQQLAIDTENLPVSIAPIRRITSLPGAMLGFLNANDSRDLDYIQLTAGQTVRFILTRPGDEAAYVPRNSIVPRLSILRPNGTAGATTTTFNSNGQMIINYVVQQSGFHRIDVTRLQGLGEYHVRAVPLASGLLPDDELVSEFASAAPPIASPNDTPYTLSEVDSRFEMLDVNGDGDISPVDVLLIINQLNQRSLVRTPAVSETALPTDEQSLAVDLFFDSNGDGLITPLDALLVINRLNRRAVSV